MVKEDVVAALIALAVVGVIALAVAGGERRV
jgi:hypothetical protein